MNDNIHHKLKIQNRIFVQNKRNGFFDVGVMYRSNNRKKQSDLLMILVICWKDILIISNSSHVFWVCIYRCNLTIHGSDDGILKLIVTGFIILVSIEC